MSNVFNRHNVNAFVAGKSQPLTGQRLSKIGYKPRGKNAAKFKSVCVSVPFIETSDVLEKVERLMPYIQNMLESTQDSIIRSLYESKNGELSSVSDDEISINACINFLEAEDSGSRLTVEFLKGWFNENLQDNLTVALCEKSGIENVEDEKIQKAVNAYRDMITSLSGGKTMYADPQIDALRKCLALASEDDDICQKLVKRLDKMQEKPNMEELLGL